MPKSPFFSVLIPTKNRSHLVGYAVQSVLDQTFEDFEIIVSDNDDSETQTRDAINSFSDPRIKYHRTTGTLSMPDNWEFALTKSKGQYITVLEDKQAFYPNALEVVHRVALNKESDVITWCADGFDNRKKYPVLVKYFGGNTVQKNSPDDILKGYLRDSKESWSKLPRMINSCVTRTFVDRIMQEAYLKRFFVDISPDYSAAFIQLNYADDTIHIDKSLVVWSALLSTAYTIRKQEAGHNCFVNQVHEKSRFYNLVPIKSYYIIRNAVLNDYLNLAASLNGRLSRYSMTIRSYIVMCFADIINSFVFGGNVKTEFRLWKNYFRSQDKSTTKRMWFLLGKTALMILFRDLLNSHPRLGNSFYKLLTPRTRLFVGYGTILDVVKDKRLYNSRLFI
jgi:glycosyltransferase involved in cell wall biosynthesis